MKTYQEEGNFIVSTENGIISYIPKDEANSDYQAYLKELTESVTDDSTGNK